MIAIERMTQKIYPGKWAELEEIDKRYNEIEGRMGFPIKKRYQCVIGAEDNNTLIIERQWDSLGAMESTYEKALADPAYQALGKEVGLIVQSSKLEVYTPLP
jgi:hypothetical protein